MARPLMSEADIGPVQPPFLARHPVAQCWPLGVGQGVFWGEIRRHAPELAALARDVVLAHDSSAVGPLLPVTRTVRIVFPVAVDPVGAGFVDQLGAAGRQRHRFPRVRIQPE
jgi:hypothetical protein